MADPQKIEAPKTDTKPRLKARTLIHKGFLVTSPIRYAPPAGGPKSATIGQIIDDLTEDDRVMFEAKGYIKPHFAPEE